MKLAHALGVLTSMAAFACFSGGGGGAGGGAGSAPFAGSGGGAGAGPASGGWVAQAEATSSWDCMNFRSEPGFTDSCTCRPGMGPNMGDRAPLCFNSGAPCCILEQEGSSYKCQCRAWFLVTDQPSQTDAVCDAEASAPGRARVDDCPPGG